MSDRSQRNRQSSERPPPQRASEVLMAVVTAVDVAAGEATAVLSGGTTFPLYPIGGFLPAVGDMVPLVRNGGDLVAFGTRHMIDGAMESGAYDPNAATGWRFDAEGNLFANSGFFRGDVTARSFKTTGDPTLGGSIEIDSDAAANTILFRRPGVLETDPARIRSEFVDGARHLSILAPGTVSGIFMREGTVNSDRWVDVRSPNLLSGGISVSRPPSRKMSRGAVAVPTGPAIHRVQWGATQYHNRLMGGSDSVALNAFSNSLIPKVAGRWRFAVTALWGNLDNYAAHVGYRFHAAGAQGADVWMNKSNPNSLETPDGQHPAEFSDILTFNGTTDELSIIAYHTAGANRNFAIRGCLLEYISPN